MNRWLFAIVGFGIGVLCGLGLDLLTHDRASTDASRQIASLQSKLMASQKLVAEDMRGMKEALALAKETKTTAIAVAEEWRKKIADLEENNRQLAIATNEEMIRLLEDESIMFEHHLKPKGGKKPMITSNPDGSESN